MPLLNSLIIITHGIELQTAHRLQDEKEHTLCSLYKATVLLVY